MKNTVRVAAGLGVVLALAGVRVAPAQESGATQSPTYQSSLKFASGREVVPYLEGWIRNPDGTFDFVFGYYNRNMEQTLIIPPGPNNFLSPGDADQGQPTYFMARRQPRIFRIRVPKDWGDKALTWTITANGRTEKVVAKLVPSYEKDERFIQTNNSTGVTFGVDDVNTPPVLKVASTFTGTVGAPITLPAEVTDDGLPKPRVVKNDDPDRPQEQAPADPLARFRSQRNSSAPPRMIGPRVIWQIYRGPGKVEFDRYQIPVEGGKAVTAARFSEPGRYTLIASAGDGKLNVFQRVTVDVK